MLVPLILFWFQTASYSGTGFVPPSMTDSSSISSQAVEDRLVQVAQPTLLKSINKTVNFKISYTTSSEFFRLVLTLGAGWKPMTRVRDGS